MNPKKMMIHEVAKLTDITIRALHYYDEIGLLEPTKADKTKYRLYSENDLEKLQQILFYREVGFSLKEIKALLSAPVYNKREALERHLELLNLRKKKNIGMKLLNVGAAPRSSKSFFLFFQPEPKKRGIGSGLIFNIFIKWSIYLKTSIPVRSNAKERYDMYSSCIF